MLSSSLPVVIAQADAPSGGAAPMMNMLILMGGFFLIIYFILIRPEKKRQAQHRTMLAELKKNDRVLTSGGIYGTIAALHDEDVVLKIDESQNVRIRVTRSSISGRADDSGKASGVEAGKR